MWLRLGAGFVRICLTCGGPRTCSIETQDSSPFFSAGFSRVLSVVSQEVVHIEAGTGDGRFLVEAGVRAVPVVGVDPGFEMGEALGGILVEPGVGPFTDGGLDEAFGFAVGARSVDARANVFELKIAAGLSEEVGVKAGTVIGHDAANGDAQASEVSRGLAQECAGGNRLFVGQQGGESDAGVIVDGDVEELPAGAAGFVLGISGKAMARFGNAGQLFDVDVQQIAGSGMLVANDGNHRLQRASGVQMQAGEDAADGGAAQASGLSDAHAGPVLAAQLFDERRFFGTDSTRRTMRPRRAIAQSGRTTLTKAAHPLGRRLPAQLELGRGRVQADFSCDDFLCELLSTVDGEAGMMVVVHSVSWLALASQTSASQFSTEWTTTS